MYFSKEELEIIRKAMAVNEIQMIMDELAPSIEFMELRDKIVGFLKSTINTEQKQLFSKTK